jgi:hypothetical protein
MKVSTVGVDTALTPLTAARGVNGRQRTVNGAADTLALPLSCGYTSRRADCQRVNAFRAPPDTDRHSGSVPDRPTDPLRPPQPIWRIPSYRGIPDHGSTALSAGRQEPRCRTDLSAHPRPTTHRGTALTSRYGPLPHRLGDGPQWRPAPERLPRCSSTFPSAHRLLEQGGLRPTLRRNALRSVAAKLTPNSAAPPPVAAWPWCGPWCELRFGGNSRDT